MTPSTPSRVHYGWVVAAITLGALVAAAAFRSSTGILMEPIEQEFGWSRTTTSGAVSLNLVLYGLVAPFAAALMEKWGVRRIVAAALVLVGAASFATTLMTAPWQLWLLWGVAIGIGTGAMALVFGAIVANRWFVARRGLVTGIFSAANATGQLLFLPLIAHQATEHGWRSAAYVTTALAAIGALLVGLFFVDQPARFALRVLRESSTRWTFWALMLSFWVCGWSTNGLIQTHFVPAAHDHGMPATTAAWLLAVVGVFDIVGTIGSGWLTDRYDSRWLLAAYYLGRGLSLLAIHQVLAPGIEPGMWVFIVFYGLDWVATVPPTVALCRQHFGLERSGVVFGWVFAAHMVGAGVGASIAGWIRTASGSYHAAWLLAAVLCFVSVAIALSIPRTIPPAITPALPQRQEP